MDVKEKAKRLLELTADEASQSQAVKRLQEIRNKAQTTCYEAQQRLHAMRVEREALMKELGVAQGSDPVIAQTVLNEVLNIMGDSACRYQ